MYVRVLNGDVVEQLTITQIRERHKNVSISSGSERIIAATDKSLSEREGLIKAKMLEKPADQTAPYSRAQAIAVVDEKFKLEKHEYHLVREVIPGDLPLNHKAVAGPVARRGNRYERNYSIIPLTEEELKSKEELEALRMERAIVARFLGDKDLVLQTLRLLKAVAAGSSLEVGKELSEFFEGI